MLKRACLALALFAASCAHYPRLSLSTTLRLEADTHLTDLSHIDATDDDWVVRVVAKGSSCSGVLVEPGVVVTAQHCVVGHDHQVRHDAGDVRVELGGDYLPWGRVGVVGIVRCPCWDDGARGDIAALVLETPMPLQVPTRRARTINEPLLDEDMLAAGFGSNDGSKLIADTGWSQRAIFLGHRSGVTTAVMDGAFVVSGLARPGDSGGPVWSRKTGEVVGIVSQGTEGQHDQHGNDPTTNEPRTDLSYVPYTIAARVDTCAGVIARAHAMAYSWPEGRWPSVVCR
jgi:Trypsin